MKVTAKLSGAVDQRHYRVAGEEEFRKLILDIIDKETDSEVNELANLIKENIINEFILSTSTSSFSFLTADDVSTNDDIINAFQNMTITRRYSGGNKLYDLKIDTSGSESLRKGIIKALNAGTGIYNEENPHMITAKNKKYMFIPGLKFMGKVQVIGTYGKGTNINIKG